MLHKAKAQLASETLKIGEKKNSSGFPQNMMLRKFISQIDIRHGFKLRKSPKTAPSVKEFNHRLYIITQQSNYNSLKYKIHQIRDHLTNSFHLSIFSAVILYNHIFQTRA